MDRGNKAYSIVRACLPYRTLFEEAPCAQITVAVDTGVLTAANRQAEKLLGVSADNLVGTALRDWVVSSEASTCREMLGGFLLSEVPSPESDDESLRWQLRVGGRGTSGRVRVEVYGQVIDESHGPLVLLVLNTLRNSHQQELGLSVTDERTRLALDATVEGFWDWNIETGEVFFSNQWLENLGYGPGELSPHVSTWEHLIHPDDRKNAEELLLSRLSGIGQVRCGENRLLTKSGEYRWFADRGRVVQRDPQGKALRMVGTDTDITKRKEAEIGRLRAEAELSRAEHLASIGVMAAGVAHEINNPLSYILNNLSFAIRVLKEEVSASASEPELIQALTDSQSGAKRVQRIVKDLNSFSRVPTDAPELLDVREPLESALSLAAKQLKGRAQLIVSIGQSPKVLADRARLGQIFLNLLINAMQAIVAGKPEENCITVRCHEGTNPSDPSVAIEVQDTGVGISAANIRRVFDPFYTTKGTDGGTGLGLSICHNLVEALGGSIEVESQPGEGTLFRVKLPAAPLEASAQVGAMARPAEPALATRRILVVDDDPLVARSIRRTLGGRHDVKIVGDGKAALAALADGSFDTVLSDVMMPGMNGMDLMEAVRDQYPHLMSAFVLMTGGVYSPEQQSRLSQLGVTCLEKPFSAADFNRAVGDTPTVAASA